MGRRTRHRHTTFGTRLRWIRGTREAERKLPERVRITIRRQQIESQKLISVLQLAVVLFFITLAAIQPEQPGAARDVQGEDLVPLVLGGYDPEEDDVEAGDEDGEDLVPLVLGGYVLFTLSRLYLAWRERLYPWFQYLSIVVDMGLLFCLIWSFHIEYGQPPSFYLKAPTMIYVFIFIGLRVLTFRARYVVAAGVAAAAGWAALSAYAVAASGGRRMVTRDYVEYMTSNSILIGAEADKIIAILVVTAILATAMARARRLVVRSAAEGEAARDLARFFSPEVANRITAAERAVEAGSGEARDAAILFCDIRGFTRFSHTVPPGEVIAMLTDYQHALVPAIQAHGGSIDKFLGDGIMATFGASHPSETAAADALRAVEAVLTAAAEWNARRGAEGRPRHRVNAAVAYGPIVFGAVGDADRLEYTVIGDPVNQAAKLEKANRTQGVHALTDRRTLEAARRQGYDSEPVEHRWGARLEGFDDPVDLVVLAPGSGSPP